MARAAKGRAASGDPTERFFEELASRGKEPLLHNTSGTVRIDTTYGATTEHFHVTVDKGHVTLSHRNLRADTVVLADRTLFNEMASGTVNTLAAYLRGLFTIEGDPTLMTSLARLFPGPPSSHGPGGTRGEQRGT